MAMAVMNTGMGMGKGKDVDMGTDAVAGQDGIRKAG